MVISVVDFLFALYKIQLNCCVVLRHPPDKEVLRICSRGLRTAGAGTISSAAVAEKRSGHESSGNRS